MNSVNPLRQTWDRGFRLSVFALALSLSNCGPSESSPGTDDGSGGVATGGTVGSSGGSPGDGGNATGGAASDGGSTSGGTSSDGGSTTGGSAPSSGGSDANGGADNAGGSGALPNWESNPANAEFFRACMDPSGHEIVLRVKTPDGCAELIFTDDIPTCVPSRPDSGWCVSRGRYFTEPELCDQAGLTDTRNPVSISVTVNGEALASEGARLDAAVAIDWGAGYTTAPPGISVSGCIANCEERDCRE